MQVHRFGLISVCLSFALLAVCLDTRGQNATPSFVVGEVHASGSHRYSEAQIAATTGLKPSDPVDRDTLQQIADGLAQLGVFARVNFRFSAKNNRATVTFELEDAPIVSVMFENFPWFTDQELSDEIRRAVPLFDGGAPRGGTLIDEITMALANKLAARGIKAGIEHTLVIQPSSDEEIMQFRQNGFDFTIASLSFSDPAAQNSEKLHDRMSDLVGKKFSRFAIELFENEQVLPIYLSAGQIRVKFGAPVVNLNSDAGQQGPSPVNVQIPIEAGPVSRLAGVAWNGNMAIDGPTLSRLLLVKSGDIADGMQLESSWRQLELAYGHRGYLDAKITAVPQFDDASGTVRYNVNIIEGPQYRMGELVITGLSLDAERRLRNAWQIRPGEVFDKTFLDSTLAKLEKPTVAIFGDLPVHYAQMGHFLRSDPQTHVIDVLIDFRSE